MNTVGHIPHEISGVGSLRVMSDTPKRLEAIDAQLAELYDLMPFGSYCIDLTGIILNINSAALALFGQSRAELVGKVIPSACFTPKSFEQLSQMTAPGNGDFDDCRLSVYGRDGAIHYVLFSGRSVGDVTGATNSRRIVITGIPESRHTTVRSAKAVDVLCKFIASKGPPHMTLEQMATLTGLTSRALAFAFRRQFDCTPIEWQRNHFLDLAHQCLEADNVTASVKTVARKFGFVSSSSFSKFYLKRFGCKPSETEYALSI